MSLVQSGIPENCLLQEIYERWNSCMYTMRKKQLIDGEKEKKNLVQFVKETALARATR